MTWLVPNRKAQQGVAMVQGSMTPLCPANAATWLEMLYCEMWFISYSVYCSNIPSCSMPWVLSFVADEDLCGQNVLLSTSFLLCELLRYLRECLLPYHEPLPHHIGFTSYSSNTVSCIISSCQLWWSWHSLKWSTHWLQYNLQLCSDLHL